MRHRCLQDEVQTLAQSLQSPPESPSLVQPHFCHFPPLTPTFSPLELLSHLRTLLTWHRPFGFRILFSICLPPPLFWIPTPHISDQLKCHCLLEASPDMVTQTRSAKSLALHSCGGYKPSLWSQTPSPGSNRESGPHYCVSWGKLLPLCVSVSPRVKCNHNTYVMTLLWGLNVECTGQSLTVKNTACLNHYISAPVPVFPEYQPLTPLGDRLYVGK